MIGSRYELRPELSTVRCACHKIRPSYFRVSKSCQWAGDILLSSAP